jgi:hypothetical protein
LTCEWAQFVRGEEAVKTCVSAKRTRIDGAEFKADVAGLQVVRANGQIFTFRFVWTRIVRIQQHGRDARATNGSLFAVIVVEGVGADESGRRGEDSPFVAVGVMAGLADGIIGDDVDDEVGGTIVDKLVRFAGLEEESVAGFDVSRSFHMADKASAGDDVVKLPLRAV